MKLIIFSGFLGSGKTKLILSAAQKITQTAKENQTKLVIIENEIGQTGIDNKVLASKGYDVKSILSGCICCTLKVELTQAINQIAKDISPEYVIFEPTGIANPINIVDSVKQYGFGVNDIDVITVVDASRWHKLMKVTPNLIQSQLKAADRILINKCDLVPDEEIDKIQMEISTMNPNVEIHRIIALRELDEKIWEGIM